MRNLTKFLAPLIGLLASVSCSDHPAPTMPDHSQPLFAVTALPVESAALSDAMERIIPSLSQKDKSAQLYDAFDDLLAAISGTDRRSIEGQLNRARAALENYDDAGGEAADLDVLSLALDAVADRVWAKTP